MGITTEEMNVKLTANPDAFVDGIFYAERAVVNFGKKSEEATNNAALGFDKLKDTIVGLGLIKGLKDTLNLAGELEQNLGGAKAVFGNYAKDMQDMAAQAYSKLGLSQSEYLATANKMGALFKGSGFSAAQSADMTTAAMQRAADVASIMGVDINSAMESVAGAAKGNFTMMDNLGVAINDTTLKLYAQEHGLGKLETTQQKVNAAMQMFLDKTEYAAGNYTKENDTFAGAFQTAKAEVLNLVAAVGTELLPAATTIIPIVTDVIREVSPVVADVANGISWVAQGLKGLDNPMGKTILYVGLATAVLNKMKFALGGTATGLILLGTLLSWVIGRFNATEEAEAAVIETSMDGAAAAADTASESVSGLTDNIEEAGKAANRLAGFDEITKLSGGSGTIASKIASTEDIANIEKAKEDISGLQTAIDGLDASQFKMPDIEFGKVVDEAAKFGGNVLKALFGNEDEKYQALNELNTVVEKFFGTEWTENWKRIGSDIFTALNDNGKKGTEALMRLRDDAYSFFGKSWTNFWMRVGGDIEDAFTAYKKATAGDWSDLMPAYLKLASNSPWLSEEQRNTSREIANSLLSGNTTPEEAKELLEKRQSSLNGFFKMPFSDTTSYDVNQIPFLLESAILDNLREGMLPQDALYAAKIDTILDGGEFERWYENYDNKISLKDVETWRNNLINAGEIVVDQSKLTPPPASASDVASIVQTNNFMGMPSNVPPTQIVNKIYLDSEQIYSENKTMTTNGMY